MPFQFLRNAEALIFETFALRPFRTSWLIVGTLCARSFSTRSHYWRDVGAEVPFVHGRRSVAVQREGGQSTPVRDEPDPPLGSPLVALLGFGSIRQEGVRLGIALHGRLLLGQEGHQLGDIVLARSTLFGIQEDVEIVLAEEITAR